MTISIVKQVFEEFHPCIFNYFLWVKFHEIRAKLIFMWNLGPKFSNTSNHQFKSRFKLIWNVLIYMVRRLLYTLYLIELHHYLKTYQLKLIFNIFLIFVGIFWFVLNWLAPNWFVDLELIDKSMKFDVK